MDYDEFIKLFGKEKRLSAYDEAKEYNIFTEYNAIIEKKTHEKSDYCAGLMLMLKYVITCVENDKINGDYYSVDNNNNVKNGGMLLHKSGGISAMHDVLMTWIPKRYRREIDIVWDGIGEWRG
ncbi:endopeptidase-like protein [Bodo saltans virus]|jgi:hypothetical protein|uniref:Endopeptidase-like protein n=1 Tax=Bodo saltans virus TaxID=2024608 RepID=A0A2H4UW21_9VIRU|nr:endopeptidase-like protein [Bodo saltans virus]ATZ81094.1 endopeptidase-like protein [Bodo saltans virus]